MSQLNLTDTEQLTVMNQLTTPLWVFDLETQRIWWANASGLEFWCAASLDDLRERPYASDSANVFERLKAIQDSIPASGSVKDIWTLYPRDQPQTVVLSFQRVTLKGARPGLLIELVQKFDRMLDDTSRIAEAAQSTPSLITMMTLEGRVLVQNAAALKCYGPPLAQDSDISDVNARYPHLLISAQLLATSFNDDVLQMETSVHTRSDKRVHYIWIKRGRDPVTGDPILVISEEDISEMSELYRGEVKRAAELEDIVEASTDRLRVTQERMRRGLQLAAIWDWDIQANQLFFSPNFIQLLGFEKEEFYNKMRDDGFEALIHPDDYVGYPETLNDIIAHPDRPLSLELRFETKSGKYLWIQIDGHCYCDETGAPVRTTGLLTDTTLKKQLEAKLIASQKLEAIGRLTGGIAHDFNNLLTVIQGNIQLLQELGQADEDLTSEVVNAVQRGADLTRHLLAFAGKQSLLPDLLDVGHLLTRMRGTLLRVLSEAIEIVIETDDTLWPVFADPAQTEAALLNIALNARDAMPKGGTLRVTAQNVMNDAKTTPELTDLAPGAYVRISITDTGTGMTPGVIAKAFEPFFTTKDVGKGSGLGLSMVLGFSQQSGGAARIQSDIEQGTSVSIYLPRGNQAKSASAPAATDMLQIGKGERIHILEDNSDVLTTVARMATSLGYNVTSSTTVRHALEVVAEDTSIEVFLIDVILPGGRSGVDFATELVKQQPDAKLILMSGFTQDELLRDITQTFDFDFLPKPFSRTALSRAVAQALRG